MLLHTHSHTHILTFSLAHFLTHLHTYVHTYLHTYVLHTLSLPLSRSLALSLSHSPTLSHSLTTLSLSHSVTHSLSLSLSHSLTRALMTVDVRVTIEKVTNRGSPHASDREQASFDLVGSRTQVGGVGGIAIVFRRGSVEGQRDDMDGPIVRLVHVRPRFHLRLVSGGQLHTVAAEGQGQRGKEPATKARRTRTRNTSHSAPSSWRVGVVSSSRSPACPGCRRPVRLDAFALTETRHPGKVSVRCCCRRVSSWKRATRPQ